MTVKDILNCITEVAPLQWQESYDNAGLQVGDLNAEAHKALICLDITEAIVDEAVLTEDERDVLMFYRDLDIDNKHLVLSIVKALAKE